MHQLAVHRGYALDLGGNICMAENAPICHGCRFPRRGVTGFAIAAYLCMGCDPAQHFSTLRVERTWVIQQPAARIRIARDGKNRDRGGDEASSR